MTSHNGSNGHKNEPFDMRHQSRHILDGVERAGARSMLKGIGLTDEDLKKPMVLIANTWIETMPCNFGLRTLAHAVKEGVKAAGGFPMEMNTIAISDGITMGTEGMKTSLVSREMIADSVELVATGHMFDAIIGLGACDKTLPGLSMALARLNIPGFLIYGGTILPGEVEIDGEMHEATVRSVYEAIGGHKAGKLSAEALKLIEDHACPSHGACGGQYTANTMAMAMEFIGLSPLGSASPPAVSWEQYEAGEGTKQTVVNPRKMEIGRHAGELIMHLLKNGIRPRDILTRDAFENAIAGVSASGGSTNAVLHLLALARRSGGRAFDRRLRRNLSPHAAHLRHDAGWPFRRCRSGQGRRHPAGRQADDRGRQAARRSHDRQRGYLRGRGVRRGGNTGSGSGRIR